MTRRTLTSVLAALLLAPISACATGPSPGRELSDADLLAINAEAWSKADWAFKQRRLGVHHGLEVVADHPCGDVCPQATMRIIHYLMDPGPGCERAGGVSKTIRVIAGIGLIPRDFCVPRVLADAA